MKKRIADIITEILVENGIKTCFSVVGGGAMHLNNAFALNSEIETIFNHHEQACAMAAEGYARLSGTMAAVCVTSGPGGLNALTGVEGAWVDSIPMIVISGHPRYETTVAATGLNLRCRGVQENDIIYAVKKITKYAKLVIEPLSIRREMQKAIKIAMDGRRGPVWLDIPLNVQGAIVETDDLEKEEPFQSEVPAVTKNHIKQVVALLSEAKRPCILTGSGIRASNAIKEFREFASKLGVPIVGGALQGDICYNGQDNYFGISGSSGPRIGNFILQNADMILVLANSLAFKQTGFNQKAFAPDAKIVMIDAQRDEGLKPGLIVEFFIHGEIKDFFNKYLQYGKSIAVDEKWFSYCKMLQSRFSPYEALENHGTIAPDERVSALHFWKEFMDKAKPQTVITLGNSSCVAGILQEGVNSLEQRILVNYNCGSMGDDLPQAIGAAIVTKDEVYCITGDGSIMMNLQELQTIRQYGLPIKVVLFMNNGYAALRNTWSNFFHGIYAGCDQDSGVSFPEFGMIAKAFGFPYFQCNQTRDLAEGLAWIDDQKGAAILGIAQQINDIQAPKVASKMLEDGTFITPALHDMSPFLSEDELYELMTAWK